MDQKLFLFSFSLQPLMDSLQKYSTIPDVSPSKNCMPVYCGLGRLPDRPGDYRLTVWCYYLWATSTPSTECHSVLMSHPYLFSKIHRRKFKWPNFERPNFVPTELRTAHLWMTQLQKTQLRKGLNLDIRHGNQHQVTQLRTKELLKLPNWEFDSTSNLNFVWSNAEEVIRNIVCDNNIYNILTRQPIYFTSL